MKGTTRWATSFAAPGCARRKRRSPNSTKEVKAMRTKVITLLAGIGFAAAASAPLIAHHAFGGEFDPNKPVLLKGKVTKIEWVNPHAWIHLEVPKADGPIACEFSPGQKCEEWMVEGGKPNTLLRRGITKESLQRGTEIV